MTLNVNDSFYRLDTGTSEPLILDVLINASRSTVTNIEDERQSQLVQPTKREAASGDQKLCVPEKLVL